ncbi:MAG TPA: PEGA domain-containing protein [Myxococcota bacterium]|nr:PEGA domain-containing protein [Myxococcota bacterium]
MIVLLSVLALAFPAGAGDSKPPARVTVLISAQDVFSRGVVGLVEHLGLERFRRQEGFVVLDTDDILRGNGEVSPSPDFTKAHTALGRGLADYENLDLARAVDELTRAAGLFESVPAEVETDPRRGYIAALIYLGAAQILSGELQQGQEAFRRLLVHDRRVQLDKSVFAPGMARTFESVRRMVIGGPEGKFSLFSMPGQARVYVDGLFKGVTPCTPEHLAAGRHLVVVRKTGYETWQGRVVVEEGQENKQRCRLLDIPGGEELTRNVARFTSGMENAKRLDGNLLRILAAAGLKIVALGRLTQSGQQVFVCLRLYAVDGGGLLGAEDGVFRPDSPDCSRIVDSLFSKLIKGRSNVLESTAVLAGEVEVLRLRDEERFEQHTPVYKTWWFWTSLGVGAATLVTLLAVLLPRSSEPQSLILLQFGG